MIVLEMSSEPIGTRQRMVEATTEALRRNGVAGTSFTEVLAESGAARGAIYHHFPGGKAELVREAVATTGEAVEAALAQLPEAAADETAIVDAFLDLIRPVVLESSTGKGCAVAAAANESSPGDLLQMASGEALEAWRRTVQERLEEAGASPDRAGALATLLLTTLEGSHVLCRAAASIEPFDRAATALRDEARRS